MPSTDEFGRYIEAVATQLWGDPRRERTATEVRFGEGRTINPEKGSWWVHGEDIGGGVLALIEREAGRKGREAVEWLRENGFHVEDRPGHEPRSISNRDARPSAGAQQRSEPKKQEPDDGAKKTIVQTWDYVDAEGAVVCQTIRSQFKLPDGSWRAGPDGKPAKTYSQRRKAREGEEDKGGWVYSLKGANLVPYRLPEMLEAIAGGYRVFFVEGEKAADALHDLGIPATCNPMGAGKWFDELTPYFEGADVVILPDNDPQAVHPRTGEPVFHEDGRPKLAGKDHAELVASKIKGVAKRVAMLELPDLPLKGDAFDWVEAGGTAERLYELAASAKEPAPPAPPSFTSSFGATWFHQIGGKKPVRRWLLKDLILANSFGIVYGPPGCGKSFIVSDMVLSACAAALDQSRPLWFGHRAQPFGVVYVVAEGSEDFEIRLHAWRTEHGIAENAVLPFVFLPTSIDMRSDKVATEKLAEEVKAISEVMKARCGVEVGVVVIDTVARALAGGNENASEVMGAFVINCDRLKVATGATVIGVHHGGKEGGKGPRGHEALHGAADFEIEVSPATEDTPNLWTVRKLKAGPAGKTHRFRLRQRTVGHDEDGDPITSCVVTTEAQTAAASGTAKPKGWRVNETEREFLTVLAETIDTIGVMPPPDLKVPQRVALVANVEEVRKRYREKLGSTEAGDADQVDARLRARWSRATKKMLQFSIIGSSSPWLWFTGKEVDRFRLKGVVDEANTYVSQELPEDDADANPTAPPIDYEAL